MDTVRVENVVIRVENVEIKSDYINYPRTLG